MSLVVMVTRGLSPVSQLQSGLLVTGVGPALAATTSAIVLATAVTTSALRGPRLRRFESGPPRGVVPIAADGGQ